MQWWDDSQPLVHDQVVLYIAVAPVSIGLGVHRHCTPQLCQHHRHKTSIAPQCTSHIVIVATSHIIMIATLPECTTYMSALLSSWVLIAIGACISYCSLVVIWFQI